MFSSTMLRRPIPWSLMVVAAIAAHAPLLFMHLPLLTFDANFHIFFAQHYARHWFEPFNVKWYGGFSQTTYPPLPQQWLAIFSYVFGLDIAYEIVQLIAIVLLPIGVYRYAKLWVDDRSASYAALGSIFLGSLSMLVYEAGQLGTTTAITLYLNALPYFYQWTRQGKGRSLIKGLLLMFAAAAAHHVTLLFGAVLFAIPVGVLALLDRETDGEMNGTGIILGRATLFAVLGAIGAAVVLLPYFIALMNNPITQTPIPHASRANYVLNPEWGFNYFVTPYGALILVIPFIAIRGWRERRLRPLLFGFWLTMVLGLGGTTPVARWLFGRAFEVLTYERFAFWATVMALPFAGKLAAEIFDRRSRIAAGAVVALMLLTMSWSVAQHYYHPINYDDPIKVDQVANFLNRDGHDKYRYFTLGFGNELSHVARYTEATTVDGDYHSARSLPEVTPYGAAQLTNSKYYGANGIAALRSMLKHASKYGIKWIFVRDPYYEPLLAFAGWRRVDSVQNGTIGIWSRDDIPPAGPVNYSRRPTYWEGIMWGLFPVGSSLLALLAVIFLPDTVLVRRPVAVPAKMPGIIYAREAK
jgi:hypothetical protein